MTHIYWYNFYKMKITILNKEYDINLQILDLSNNQLLSLQTKILNIKNILLIDVSSYNINNLNIDNEILIFSNLKDKINNLPFNIKEIWLKSDIKNYDIKLPINCKIKYY